MDRRRLALALVRQGLRTVGATSAGGRVWLRLAAVVGALVVSGCGLLVLLVVVTTATMGSPPAVGGVLGIGPIVFSAYLRAVALAGELAPGCQVRWQILAGVGWAESRHANGRHISPAGDVIPQIIGMALDGTNGTRRLADTDGGRWDHDPVWDRATGPMQFLPSSWELYGRDGNGDGVADPHNVYDAAAAAVVHLCGAGAVDLGDESVLRRALYAYNHSSAYVEAVVARIAFYDATPASAYWAGEVDGGSLASHPNLTLTDRAAADLTAGVVDPRVVGLLARLVERHQLAVSVFKTGHSKCVGGGDYAGCSVSNHFYGRAVDIWMVDGVRVSAANGAAHELVYELLAMGPGDPLRPQEVGSPFVAYDPLPIFFTDGDHLAHVHLGWE